MTFFDSVLVVVVVLAVYTAMLVVGGAPLWAYLAVYAAGVAGLLVGAWIVRRELRP